MPSSFKKRYRPLSDLQSDESQQELTQGSPTARRGTNTGDWTNSRSCSLPQTPTQRRPVGASNPWTDTKRIASQPLSRPSNDLSPAEQLLRLHKAAEAALPRSPTKDSRNLSLQHFPRLGVSPEPPKEPAIQTVDQPKWPRLTRRDRILPASSTNPAAQELLRESFFVADEASSESTQEERDLSAHGSPEKPASPTDLQSDSSETLLLSFTELVEVKAESSGPLASPSKDSPPRKDSGTPSTTKLGQQAGLSLDAIHQAPANFVPRKAASLPEDPSDFLRTQTRNFPNVGDVMERSAQRMSGDARRYISASLPNRYENQPPGIAPAKLCRNGPQCRKNQEGLLPFSAGLSVAR